MPQPSGEGTKEDTLSRSDIEELFFEYHPKVYAYVRYRVANVAEAEDLTSDIMERALRYLSSYDRRKGAFSTWLFRIAHNTWVNYVKKWKRRDPVLSEWDDAFIDLPMSDPGPEQAVVQKQDVARALRDLETLSERQQEILSLRFAGRLTNREIARVLDMNERTVSVTILRALRKLRRRLESEDR
jgi:RNA polymerase sigma-70 factor (ECF subfamily)